MTETTMSEIDLIMADVTRSHRTGTPIYDGTARTIAAGWHGGNNDGITGLSHTGRIVKADVLAEIDEEITFVQAHPHNFDAHKRVKDLGTARQNIAMLRALRDYIERTGNRGCVPGWHRVWVDELTPEMEYNTDDEF